MCASSNGVASGSVGSHVDEVHGLIVDLGDEVRDGVHPRFLGAPIELLPRSDHLLQVADWRSVLPAVTGCFDRVAGVG